MKKSNAYKMKYQGKHSAFPFKESPIKLDEGTHYVPFEKGPFNPGQSTELPGQQTVPPHSHSDVTTQIKNPKGMQTPLDPGFTVADAATWMQK